MRRPRGLVAVQDDNLLHQALVEERRPELLPRDFLGVLAREDHLVGEVGQEGGDKDRVRVHAAAKHLPGATLGLLLLALRARVVCAGLLLRLFGGAVAEALLLGHFARHVAGEPRDLGGRGQVQLLAARQAVHLMAQLRRYAVLLDLIHGLFDRRLLRLGHADRHKVYQLVEQLLLLGRQLRHLWLCALVAVLGLARLRLLYALLCRLIFLVLWLLWRPGGKPPRALLGVYALGNG
jgi:hypothetical protein